MKTRIDRFLSARSFFILLLQKIGQDWGCRNGGKKSESSTKTKTLCPSMAFIGVHYRNCEWLTLVVHCHSSLVTQWQKKEPKLEQLKHNNNTMLHKSKSSPSYGADVESGSSSTSSTSLVALADSDTDLDRAAKLNPIEVIDDLSINRWLMRIMRLGQHVRHTGSSGYGQHLGGMPLGTRGRRMSAFEVNSERIGASSSNGLLRPPITSLRSRRFSDSTSASNFRLLGQTKPRRGKLFFHVLPSLILYVVMIRAIRIHVVIESCSYVSFSIILGSVEQSNLLRMRNSNLGQSAPSLSASTVSNSTLKFLGQTVIVWPWSKLSKVSFHDRSPDGAPSFSVSNWVRFQRHLPPRATLFCHA